MCCCPCAQLRPRWAVTGAQGASALHVASLLAVVTLQRSVLAVTADPLPGLLGAKPSVSAACVAAAFTVLSGRAYGHLGFLAASTEVKNEIPGMIKLGGMGHSFAVLCPCPGVPQAATTAAPSRAVGGLCAKPPAGSRAVWVQCPPAVPTVQC